MIPHRPVPFLGPDDLYPVTTLDGSDTLFSVAHGVTYHSINGAVSESRHVFIQNCLYAQRHLPEIRVLEIGFGTGLNAFLAYLFSIKHHINVRYLGIEPFPVREDIAIRLNYPSYLAASFEEHVFKRMHGEDAFEVGGFSFGKLACSTFKETDGQFDCIFFDAFDPATQPELWSPAYFKELFIIAASGGILTTYCAKGEVRRGLIEAGFIVDRIPGAPGKRQMISARKP